MILNKRSVLTLRFLSNAVSDSQNKDGSEILFFFFFFFLSMEEANKNKRHSTWASYNKKNFFDSKSCSPFLEAPDLSCQVFEVLEWLFLVEKWMKPALH